MRTRVGLRSGLRTWLELAEQSAADRRALVRLAPAKVLSTWSPHSGACYSTPARVVTDAGRLVVAVTGVRAGNDATPLERAESLADCIAGAGTFYFDPDQGAGNDRAWDDGLAFFDAADPWDATPFLYVHLAADAEPATTTVLAELAFVLSGRGDVVPDLGPEKLANPGFEQVAPGQASSSPAGWTLANGAGAGPTVGRDASAPASGSWALVVRTPGEASPAAWDDGEAFFDAGGAWDYFVDPDVVASQVLELRAGAWYLASGRYRTAAGSGLAAYVRVGLPASGRFVDAAGELND